MNNTKSKIQMIELLRDDDDDFQIQIGVMEYHTYTYWTTKREILQAWAEDVETCPQDLIVKLALNNGEDEHQDNTEHWPIPNDEDNEAALAYITGLDKQVAALKEYEQAH